MEMMWLVWLLLGIALIITEALTVALVSIWFVAGAFCAMAASLMGASLGIQIAVMLAVSLLLFSLFLLLRKKLGIGKADHVPTNAELLIGCEGTVIAEIDPIESRGLVKVKGQVWSAFTDDETVIPEQAQIIVCGISGVKLIVKEVKP